MILHEDSHTDHVSREVLKWALLRFQDKEEFFAETVEVPSHLLGIQCGLYGPIMGDPPITEDEVTYQARPGREWPSRLIDKPLRPTQQISVIGGPYKQHSCILYTCFGGPLSPKEPQDPTLDPEKMEASVKFWSEHALGIS